MARAEVEGNKHHGLRLSRWNDMARYTVQDTQSGKNVTFDWNGEQPPTDADMQEVFAQAIPTKEATQPQGAGIPLAFAGGANKGIAGLLGMPVDLMNTVIGGHGGAEPVGGSAWLGKLMPKSPKPQGMAENIVSGIGEQVPYAIPGVGMAAKGGGLLNTLFQAAKPVVGAGVGAGVARETAPDSPVAEIMATMFGAAGPGVATQGLQKLTTPAGRRLIESGMKIPTSLKDNLRNKAIDAMVEFDIPFAKRGLQKVKNLRANFDNEISQAVDGITNNIDLNNAAKRIDDMKAFYSKLPPDVAADYLKPLDDIQQKFASGGIITPKDAQEMKQTLYALNRKNYGELKNASVEGNKAVARGLKELLVEQEPRLAMLNEKDAALINLEKVMGQSLHRARNYDIVRLSDMITAGVGGVVGGTPGAIGGYVLKRVLEDPYVKVELGKALAKAGKKAISVPISRLFIAGHGAIQE